MGNIQEYKCPCCGGAIHFDSTIQKMKCPYCDTEFEMEALQGYDEALNQEKSDEMVWDTSAGTEWGEGETNGLHTYQCQSCGGEIVGDESMAASACPYCGNPIVVTGQFSGALKPDYVIPFKLDKKAAKDGMITEKPFYIYSDNTHKHFSSGMNAVYERFSCGSSRLVNNND